MIKEIPLYEPYLKKDDTKYISKVINQRWVSTSGKNISVFEKKISTFVNSKYALALNSGTSSLDIALKCLGVGYGHLVLVPTVTFVAPINSILYNGAEPVFFDCDDYLNINTEDILIFLKTKTKKNNNRLFCSQTGKLIKAIILVHVYGVPAKIFDLKKICKKFQIKIVEDASESLGSYIIYKNKKIHTGTIGDIGCFSFNGNKLITTGSGGMIVTNIKKHFLKAKFLSSQSKNDPLYFIHNEVGYNYRMNNLSASLGLSQLEKIDFFLKKKKYDHNLYVKKLHNNNNFEIMQAPINVIANNWLNLMKIKKKINRKKFFKIISAFHDNKIYVRPLWYPNHLQKYLKKYKKFRLLKIKKLMNNIICLPSSVDLNKEQINFVINFIKKLKI
jgi:perosamine synthetase